MGKEKSIKKTSFGERVRAWRDELDLTQLEAARAIADAAQREVSFQLYQKIEYGRQPLEWFVIAFANVSRQDVNDLLRVAGLTQIEKAALPLA